MDFGIISELEKEILYTFDPQGEKSIIELFGSEGYPVPKSYRQFIKQFGAIYIMDDVMVKGLTAIPRITIKDDYVPIGAFLSWDDSHRSIQKIMETYKDQFPDNFVPIAEGCSGDYIGFSFDKNGQYFVGYWFHEELLHFITHKVSEDFLDFINSIFRYSIQIDDKTLGKITHNPSPKMIELLKKTGKWMGD